MSDRHYWPTTVLSLLTDLKSGRREAWNRFVDQYGPLILRYCRSHRLMHDDAEEVTQEVFLRIHAAIPDFLYDPTIGQFGGWVGRITHHELIRYVTRIRDRAVATAELDRLDAVGGGVEGQWNDLFYQWVLEQAFEEVAARVGPDKWQCFYECWKHNENPGDLARRLNLSPDFVYKARHQIRQMLFQMVEELLNRNSIQ